MALRLVKADPKAEEQYAYILEMYEDENRPDLLVPIFNGKIFSPPTLDGDEESEITTRRVHRFDLSQRYIIPAWCAAKLDLTLREMGFEYLRKERPDSHFELWAEGEKVTRERIIRKPAE